MFPKMLHRHLQHTKCQYINLQTVSKGYIATGVYGIQLAEYVDNADGLLAI